MLPLLSKTASLPWGRPSGLDLSRLKHQGAEKSRGQLSPSVLQTGSSSGGGVGRLGWHYKTEEEGGMTGPGQTVT